MSAPYRPTAQDFALAEMMSANRIKVAELTAERDQARAMVCELEEELWLLRQNTLPVLRLDTLS